jgi:hypothetical protein
MKFLLASLLLTLSINLYADGCNSPDWVFAPKMEGKVLILRIKGTCTLNRIGTFNSLRDHFVKNVTKTQVVKVHQMNENNIGIFLLPKSIPHLSKNDDGDMTVRFLTKVGTDGQDHFVYDQILKKLLKLRVMQNMLEDSILTMMLRLLEAE